MPITPMKEIMMPPSNQTDTMIEVQPANGLKKNKRRTTSTNAYAEVPANIVTPVKKIAISGRALNEVTVLTI